jgi:hypothetical protein
MEEGRNWGGASPTLGFLRVGAVEIIPQLIPDVGTFRNKEMCAAARFAYRP